MEGRALEDAEGVLVERARKGDVAAYEALVRRYQALAFRTAYLILGGAADAEDAAQDAFVKAYYALGRFRPGAPLRPWLLQIVANEARNRRKAATRRVGLALRVADERLGGNTVPSAETVALVAEERAYLLAALHDLREDDRRVVACRYFLDLSEAEMAAVLGIPRGTVKSRLARALGRLRARLGADDTAETAGGRGVHG